MKNVRWQGIGAMQKALIRWFFVIGMGFLGFPLCIAAVEEVGGANEKAIHVRGFKVDHGGHRYWLPAHVKIQRDGATLYEDASPSIWITPYKGVQFNSFGKYLLLKTYDDDFIDIRVERLFMIAPDGSVIHQPVWTSHWRDGFFISEGQLRYWSEWFCHEQNKERKANSSYIYIFSEDKQTFERKDLDQAAYCTGSIKLKFLEFKDAHVEAMQ